MGALVGYLVLSTEVAYSCYFHVSTQLLNHRLSYVGKVLCDCTHYPTPAMDGERGEVTCHVIK
jgi:hypothetical protein